MKKAFLVILLSGILFVGYSLYDRAEFVSNRAGAFVVFLFPGHERLQNCHDAISVEFAEIGGRTYVRCNAAFWPFYDEDVMEANFASHGFEIIRQQSVEHSSLAEE